MPGIGKQLVQEGQRNLTPATAQPIVCWAQAECMLARRVAQSVEAALSAGRKVSNIKVTLTQDVNSRLRILQLLIFYSRCRIECKIEVQITCEVYQLRTQQQEWQLTLRAIHVQENIHRSTIHGQCPRLNKTEH